MLDRVREAMFGTLADLAEDARVLDLYAGSGSLALEALSRGAISATCIESDRRAAALIADNAALCRESDRCVIIRDVASRALAQAVPGGPFDIIVLDPPYDYQALAETVASAATQRAGDGLVVLEHAARVRPPQPAGLTLARTVTSGDSALTFYS